MPTPNSHRLQDMLCATVQGTATAMALAAEERRRLIAALEQVLEQARVSRGFTFQRRWPFLCILYFSTIATLHS